MGLVMFAFFSVYQNVPREPIELKASGVEPELIAIVDYGAVPVFIENLRFNHNDISYFIEADCSDVRRASMIKAFEIFAKKMMIISFHEVSSGADINVGCSDDYIPMGERLFAAGEGGPSRIINTSVFKTIEQGKIVLYDNQRCDLPIVELHELGHVFGFDHSDDPLNVMYNVSDCRQSISDDMVKLIYELYSIEPLPDASIGDLVVVKRGRYLDFNISVLNEGLIDIDSINLTIVADGEDVEVMNLGGIGIGYGRTLRAQNIKLPSLSVDRIEFVVDKRNRVREFNEGNNVVSVAA